MKKTLIKPLAWLTCIAILTSSCSSEEPTTPQTQNTINKEIPFSSIKMDENGQLKMKFAESLANALVANKDLRRLVKEEALKQFDKDYDVMYQLVKKKSLTPIDYNGKNNGKIDKSILSKSSQATTFRQALLPFFKNEAELLEIEQKIPLLTIFVPDLPLGTFSAETWDVNDENQVPDVALRLNTTNDVPVIGKDGNNYVIEAELTPGFPIIVIKENERVRVKKNSNNKTAKLATVGFEDFEYIDDNFDPDANWVPTPIINYTNISDPLLVDAYSIWNGNDGWQRDYIYHGLKQGVLQGPLNRNYSEHIATFKLQGDPKVAFNYISVNSTPGEIDPQQNNEYRLGGSGWTDGAFEFNVYCYLGSKPNAAGEAKIKSFGFKPDDLFVMTHTKFTRGSWPSKKTWFRTEIVTTKEVNFRDPKYGQKVEIYPWDLSIYGADWEFKFEEFDATVLQKIGESVDTKIAVNVNGEMSGSIFEIIKVGLKWGVSKEVTKTNTYNLEFTTSSNPLGSSIISFYNNAVNKNPTTGALIPRTYTTGRVEFSVIPIRVQW
ncbi:conserved exported hypothetical protein [Flavobacterium sp. 9R]|uniref:hypothetical protein n=1 Tax=Flavobacterium sp. 9R TaxID=2653143 RepID=UPI0012F31B10|nr:hypothetical protein [Flavobacterium sp. 9R]VXB28895.1 conserved exported hypothetical protein [Flavobacterium sp. 9R]